MAFNLMAPSDTLPVDHTRKQSAYCISVAIKMKTTARAARYCLVVFIVEWMSFSDIRGERWIGSTDQPINPDVQTTSSIRVVSHSSRDLGATNGDQRAWLIIISSFGGCVSQHSFDVVCD